MTSSSPFLWFTRPVYTTVLASTGTPIRCLASSSGIGAWKRAGSKPLCTQRSFSAGTPSSIYFCRVYSEWQMLPRKRRWQNSLYSQYCSGGIWSGQGR